MLTTLLSSTLEELPVPRLVGVGILITPPDILLGGVLSAKPSGG